MSAGQRIELDAFSAYTRTPVYSVDGAVVFGLMQDVILPDSTDQVYEVPSAFAGRLDLVANAFYSTPQLWWVIASVNNLIDALNEPQTGALIRIPSRERLAKEGIVNV